MPSKFGGIPVEENSTTKSRFGGIPVGDQQPAVPAATEEPKSLPGFLSNIPASAGRLLGNMGQAILHPIDTAQGVGTLLGGMAGEGAPGTWQSQVAYPAFRGAMEGLKNRYGGLKEIGNTLYSDPVGAAADASALLGAGGGLLRGAGAIADAGGAGRIAGLLRGAATGAETAGDVANPLTLPLKGAGEALKVGARGLAKSALSLPSKAEAYGATPAKALLEETRGVRPATIAESARGRIGELSNELESRAAAAPGKTSLAPARSLLEDKMLRAAQANSEATPRELEPMHRFLTVPGPQFAGEREFAPAPGPVGPSPILGPNGQPLPSSVQPQIERVAEQQSPSDLLKMKRQFDTDFVSNWSPTANTKGQLGVARQVHHALGSEINRAVPEAAGLNQRISSLIPVERSANMADLSAGPIERGLNRATRPTGALIPAIFGLHEGGVPGLATMLAGQELLSSPTAKMIGARGAYGGGAGAAAPITRRSLILLPEAGKASQ